MILRVLAGTKYFSLFLFILVLFQQERPRNNGQVQWELLNDFLVHYEKIDAEGGWPRIAAGEPLRQGLRDPRIKQLRERLLITRDLTDSATSVPDSFDVALQSALMHFQLRHGLSPSGETDPQTLAALNVPVSVRIAQLKINMQRWLALGTPEPAHVFVNTAEFQLQVVEHDSVALEMKVIIGKASRQTPVFRADMKYLEFNPSWYVPPGIARRDILPRVQKNAGYLSDSKTHVMEKNSGKEIDPDTVNWNEVDGQNLPYSFVQDPGAGNPLGQVKFVFPNPHFVYMHDTPSRELFAAKQPMFSSGCIRVSAARDLAVHILKDNPSWTPQKIDSAIATGETCRVYLLHTVPVYIEYLTAWVDSNGDLQFRNDVYRRDQ